MRYWIVPTVQHTGSRFLVTQFLGGITQKPIKNGVGPGLYWDHVWPHKREWWSRVIDRGPILVPLRSPYAVAASWEKRGRPLEEMAEQWGELIEWVDGYEPCYLPLDTDDRDERLHDAGRALGREWKTDWPVIGSYGREVELRDRGTVDRIVKRHEAFFGRFYDFPVRGKTAAGLDGRERAADDQRA